jgi:hypothetical protein
MDAKTKDLKSKLVVLFPEYTFIHSDNIEGNSIFGVKTQEIKEYRNSEKSLIREGNRYIFVSSEMYPNTDRNFRYAIIETKGTIRPYRCKNTHEIDIDKRYASGVTDDKLLECIKDQFLK